MVVIKWRTDWRDMLPRIRTNIQWKMTQAKLTARSLTYNEHMSYNYLVDCLLEPMFWFVDNFVKYLGKVYVFCVVVLTTGVVLSAYWIGVPYWWDRNPYVTVFLIIFGNWILLNVIFHYYMGIITPPGYPPEGSTITEAVSICKKCLSPKPPRTHHCSVCDRCVLAMDHHCPWLNNCVGYYNARYFYLYMVFTVAGVLFLIAAGIDLGVMVIFIEDSVDDEELALWLAEEDYDDETIYEFDNELERVELQLEGSLTPHNDPDLIGHPVVMNQSGVLVPVKVIAEYDSETFPREHNLPEPVITETQRIAANPWKHKAVMSLAVICIAVVFALGVLTYMHGKNITRGETSVEAHINASLKKTQKDSFRNPYDFGAKKNWKLFLGLVQGRTFVRHVLWPSSHKPVGNGLTFHTVHEVMEDWP